MVSRQSRGQRRELLSDEPGAGWTGLGIETNLRRDIMSGVNHDSGQESRHIASSSRWEGDCWLLSWPFLDLLPTRIGREPGVGWCLAEYHYQSHYELGIETMEAYRRQGIATHVASAVITRAFAEGATEIGWHCWASNIPSIATALKLGFQKELEYPVILCDSRLVPTPAQ